jgi:hypothetical protein
MLRFITSRLADQKRDPQVKGARARQRLSSNLDGVPAPSTTNIKERETIPAVALESSSDR